MQYIFKQAQVRVFSHSPDKLGHLYKLLMDKFHYWKLKQALQDKLNRFSVDHGNPVKMCENTSKAKEPIEYSFTWYTGDSTMKYDKWDGIC